VLSWLSFCFLPEKAQIPWLTDYASSALPFIFPRGHVAKSFGRVLRSLARINASGGKNGHQEKQAETNRSHSRAGKAKGQTDFGGSLSCLPPLEAPLAVLALTLVTIRARLAKAVEISFTKLFLVNHRRDGLSEALIAKRWGEIVRPPRDHGILVPFLAALHALNSQSIHAFNNLRSGQCVQGPNQGNKTRYSSMLL
jgi:hypothetical protein